jgi:hypothetical protein
VTETTEKNRVVIEDVVTAALELSPEFRVPYAISKFGTEPTTLKKVFRMLGVFGADTEDQFYDRAENLLEPQDDRLERQIKITMGDAAVVVHAYARRFGYF